jgi:hypothetical protein
MDSNLPVPNGHMEVLYRQTYNTIGQAADATCFTQDNVNINTQSQANTIANGGRLGKTLGVLAGSLVAVAGDNLVGPAKGDSTTVADKVVGVAINDAVGNPFESSSGIASERIVYCHGTGTVFQTDIYETYTAGNVATPIAYTAGDLLYASRGGLLSNASGLLHDPTLLGSMRTMTVVGICLKAPSGSSDPYMMVQLKI